MFHRARLSLSIAGVLSAASAITWLGGAHAAEPKVVFKQVTEPTACDDYSWVPRTLAKAPQFKSDNVRYNIWVLGDGKKSVMTMAWDESGGTGTGYDTLYVDRNFNLDLTEDGEKLTLIKRDKDPKHAYPPLEGIKEADGDKTFNFKLVGWYGDYTIGWPSEYTATWPGGSLRVGATPGDVRLMWSTNGLAAAPIYRLGGQNAWFLNDKLAGEDMGTWTAGDTATVMWYAALLGDRRNVQLRNPVDNKFTILRVLDPSGAVVEDIPFSGHCTCGGGFTTTLLIPTRVPPGRHLVVGRVPETKTEYLYPVQILNPDFGKPIDDPALQSLKARFPDPKVKFAALRRVGSNRNDAEPGHPEEKVVPTPVFENTLTPRHGEGGQREHNNGTSPHMTFSSAGGWIKYDEPLSSLLKIDLAGIPKETRILGAELRLTLLATQFIGTGDKAGLTAYAVRRPWNETRGEDGYSCWLGPRCTASGDPTKAWIVSGEAWGAPGCEDTAKDRFAEAAGSVAVAWFPASKDPKVPREKRRVVSMDLTDLVKRWHSGELPNHGVLMKLAGGTLTIATSEFTADRAAYRPTLVIAYEGPAPVAASTLKPEEDLTRAREIAAKQNRPLAVKFFSPMCKTCQQVAQTTFVDGRLQEILRNGYVTVSLPIETFSKEAAALGVSEVPTLMLLKPDGKTISILTSDTLLDAQATKAALEGALK